MYVIRSAIPFSVTILSEPVIIDITFSSLRNSFPRSVIQSYIESAITTNNVMNPNEMYEDIATELAKKVDWLNILDITFSYPERTYTITYLYILGFCPYQLLIRRVGRG